MDLLAESAVRVAVLSIAVGLGLRALRIRSPRLVHRAWTLVIVVMLMLPVSVAWGLTLAVPVLPSAATLDIVAPASDVAAAVTSNRLPMIATTPAGGPRTFVTWRDAVLMVYVAGVCLFLVRLAIGVRRARAIRRDARPVHGRLAHPSCVTPMTIGMLSPVVILPADWASWSDAELSAVVAHEEEHVRRRDPLVAGVALLNRAIFWFHPLAWWLQRTIASLSEQACDAVVISRGHDTDVYSACLLRFARRAAHAGGRIAPMATAMPGAGLRARIERLTDPLPAPPSRSRLACAAIAGVALVVVCAAAVPAAAPPQVIQLAPASQAVWPIYTSEHFEIIHDHLSEDRVSEAVRELEAAYAQVSAALKYDMPRLVRVRLVRRDRDAPDSFAAATARSVERQIVLSVESLDRRNNLEVHELTHLFAFEIIPATSRVAPVLVEGLAEHQRGAWNAMDLGLMRTAASASAIPPLSVLVNTDRHWAHAVFDFVSAHYGDEGVRQLIFGLRAHETLPPAVPMALGVTFDQFEEQFRSYATATFSQP
jgi:beta-lactamase regulating signal transducer with metallopeptidase domain